MLRYTLIGLTRGNTSCNHCGRGIKNLVIVRDNMTKEILTIGTTCIDKVMKLNPTFNKSLQKEMKRFNKLKKEYEGKMKYSIDELIIQAYNRKMEYKKEHNITEDHYEWKYYNDSEMIRGSIQSVSYIVNDMLRKTKEFNKLSKSGLIDIQDITIYEENLKKFNDRFQSRIIGNDWEYNLDNEKDLLLKLK